MLMHCAKLPDGPLTVNGDMGEAWDGLNETERGTFACLKRASSVASAMSSAFGSDKHPKFIHVEAAQWALACPDQNEDLSQHYNHLLLQVYIVYANCPCLRTMGHLKNPFRVSAAWRQHCADLRSQFRSSQPVPRREQLHSRLVRRSRFTEVSGSSHVFFSLILRVHEDERKKKPLSLVLFPFSLYIYILSYIFVHY